MESAPKLQEVESKTVGDLALAARCVAGDRDAQKTLFHREKGRVHATLFRVLGSNSHMDDLVQESFLEVFRSLRGYRGEARLSTWIDRCTARVAYAYIGKKKRIGPVLEIVNEPAADVSSGEDREQARAAMRELYRLLDRLPAAQRIAFVLHAIEGRPISEVASVVGASSVATKVRIFRARREIEKRSAEYPALAELLRSS